MGELYSFLDKEVNMVRKSDYSKEEDLRIIELFNKGYTNREIGEELNRTKAAIQKRIQLFKKENFIIEKVRTLKQLENREFKRTLNRENSNFLSNGATVKACMSAYRNNSKGDLVLNTDKAENENFVYTEDMPKKLENKEIREYIKIFE